MLRNFYKNVGVDLGTANTLLYLSGQGIVINEPTMVAVNQRTNQILNIGAESKKMLDRTPEHIKLIKPLIHGVVSDFEMTEEILKYFLRKAGKGGFFSRFNAAAISVPTNLTEVERKSVEDAVVSAGAGRVFLVEAPLAAAIGARLPIEEPTSNMIIDMGGGTTEISIISVGGTVKSKSLKIAGEKFNEEIIKGIKDEFGVLIGEPTAEEIKVNIGSAIPLQEKLEITIRGRNVSTGLPKEITLRDTQVRAMLQKSLKGITEAIKTLIEESPPELVGDILKRGIYLTGGTSKLRGLDKYIASEITVATAVVEDPLTCTVRGLGIIIEDMPTYKNILLNQQQPRVVNI
ncbi:MAG: rod shape-determining protein [Candidatus Colwellbacteria bacterium]|nr:rod shape-determining protein [Candidatus Colwellbacteria bacterium]